MAKSILTKNQKKTFTKKINYEGKICTMSVTLRYDDECGNGHNTFSITGSIKGGKKTCYGYEIELGGCIHDDIEKYFPEFAHLIKWHLCNSDSPMYYIENSSYWMKKNDIENAKKTVVWGATSLDKNPEDIASVDFLQKRLPELMANFQNDIEAIGFVY